jgi:hypothetical protein
MIDFDIMCILMIVEILIFSLWFIHLKYYVLKEIEYREHY